MSRLRWFKFWLMAIPVALLFAASPAAADIPTFQVRQYEQDFSVATETAERNLETQELGSAIVGQPKAVLGKQYAGVWFDNNAGEFVIPLLPGSNRAKVTALLTDDEIANAFRISQAKSSWRDLEAALEHINESLESQIKKQLIQTSIDPRTNSVVIHQAKAVDNADEAALQHLASSNDTTTEIEPASAKQFDFQPLACRTSAPRACGRPLRGGVSLTRNTSELHQSGECSVGFKATVNGNRYILTAGHCAAAFPSWGSEDASENFHPIGTVASYSFPGGDWGTISANGSSYWDWNPWPSEVAHYWEDQERSISYEGWSYLGDYVCHSGTSTGTSCGGVSALNVTSSYGVNHLTEVRRVCAFGGDSGGPVFEGHTALGLLSGGDLGYPECERPILYAEITEATNALGVSVGTRLGGPPTATTTAASDIRNAEATIHGNVNPNSVETHYRFDYGTTTGYGSSAPSSEGNIGHGTGTVGLDFSLSNLQPGTTYHYRVVATSAAGTSYGSDQQFTTPPAGPSATISTNGVIYSASVGSTLSIKSVTRLSNWAWQTPISIAGSLSAYSKPASVMDSSGNLFVLAQGPNHTLQEIIRYADGTWHGPYEVGGQGAAYSAPAVAYDSKNNILYVVAEGANHTLQETQRFSDWSWHGPSEVGGPGAAYSAPAMVFDAPNNILYVVAEGANHTLQETQRFSDWSWHGPSEVGGPGAAYSAPAMVMDSTNDLFVVAAGVNHKLMETQRYGDWSWHGPSEVAGDGTAY